MYQNRSDSDRHSSYMDGIPVKISELYKPPKRISLPLGIANRQPIENFEKYDFRLERSTAEKMARLRELKKANMEKRRQRIAEEDRKIEELKKAAELKQKACETATAQKQDSTPTQETDIPPERKPIIVENDNPVEKRSEVASYMLTPVPVNQTHNQQLINSFDPINISDFESDSSPFDNMELKTLNDIAELASVLQPNNGTQYSAYNHRISNQTFNQRLSNQSIHDQTYNQDSQRLGNQPIHDQTYNQDSHRLSNQAMHDQTYNQDGHQPMLDQQGYQIKPSRPFIQQSTPNIPPSNGYRINGLYGGSNVFSTSSVSDSFWNNQQTVSYSSTRTTPSAYGGAVSATYRPEFSGYFQNNDYRPENSVYSNVCMPRTGLFCSAVSQQTTSTASDIGTSKYMLPTSNDTRLVGVTPATRISSNNSEYLAGAREYAPNYSWTNYNYQPQNVSYDVSRAQTSDQLVPSRPQTSDNLVESRVRPSDNRVQPSDNLAQSRVRPSDTLVENRLQPSDNQVQNRLQTSDNLVESRLQPSDTLVESRQSTDSGVTDLIRQLKLDLDDRRESDCRKLIENETKSSVVESEKLKQKISSAVVAPQLPNPIEQLTPSCRQLVHRIAEMGFAEERVARAVQRLGNNETKVLEFLLQVQRLEEESGSPGERVEQALIANRFDTVESARYLEILQQLLDLGFVETKVAEALAQHANDRDKAIESLIS